MKRITIKDVAKEVGVSPTVVSRVLNAPRREDGSPACDIGKATAERVFETVKRLGYRPSKFAAGFRSGKRFVIGVVTPDISNYAFSEAGRVIEELAFEDGYTVMFGSSAESAAKMEGVINAFVENGVDGLIVTPCAGSEAVLRKVVSDGIPVVLSNRDIPSLEGVGRVFLDNVLSMRKVVKHLFDNGFRKIEMISEKMDVSSLVDREDSYKETMSSLGLSSHVYYADTLTQEADISGFVADAGMKGTEALITPRIMLSLYSLKAIKALGLSIPEDITLFCHDDSPVFRLYTPTISYVSQCSDKVGTQAYRMLRSMMSGEKGGRILIEPEMFFGESTAPKTRNFNG